jgi:hypothetical protein
MNETTAARQSNQFGRRELLCGLGVGAISAAAISSERVAAQQTNLDPAILTFALNLEYLEAEFYSIAAFGFGLPPEDVGPSPGTVTGGRRVDFDNPLVRAYAYEIAEEERKHVQFLRAALTAATGSAVSRPAIDFKNSFPTLAAAAGLGTGFDAFANTTNFLLAAYVFEDVGVTAYHGAAPLITNKAYLDRAAGILAVEAYHAGLIRTVLFVDGKSRETELISNLRASLDGTAGTLNVDDHGVGTLERPTIVDASDRSNGSLLGGFPTNNPPGDNAIAYDRTTRQVLNIVYGAAGASRGLFFPNGLNGPISS